MQGVTKHSVTEAHPSRVFRTARDTHTCGTAYWLWSILDALSGGVLEVQVVCRGREEAPRPAVDSV